MIVTRDNKGKMVVIKYFYPHGAGIILLRDLARLFPNAAIELAGRRLIRVHRLDLSMKTILELNPNAGVGV